MHTTKIEKPNISMQNQLLYLQDLFHNFIYNNFGGLINEKDYIKYFNMTSHMRVMHTVAEKDLFKDSFFITIKTNEIEKVV